MRVLLLLLLLLQPGQALAHAALLEASPADGSALDTAPAEMRDSSQGPGGVDAVVLR